jgi:hypothetical protein
MENTWGAPSFVVSDLVIHEYYTTYSQFSGREKVHLFTYHPFTHFRLNLISEVPSPTRWHALSMEGT